MTAVVAAASIIGRASLGGSCIRGIGLQVVGREDAVSLRELRGAFWKAQRVAGSCEGFVVEMVRPCAFARDTQWRVGWRYLLGQRLGCLR